MADHILAILPSKGLGGGIERYWNWLRGVAEEGGATVDEQALLGPGELPSLQRKVRFAAQIFAAARRSRHATSVEVVVAHPNLTTVSWLACRCAVLRPERFAVAFYGSDIRGLGPLHRWVASRLPIQPITISSFSAGTLSPIGPPTIVPPGIAADWYELLAALPQSDNRPDGRDATDPGAQTNTVRVLTVFRLSESRGKGLPQIVDALDQVRDRTGIDIHLTVAGSGTLPDDSRTLVSAQDWITVVSGLSDEHLATLYHRADIFVLATRTTFRPPYSGEGFGIVLVEAQLAGTPVVAPAHGGSDDAFLDGITGVKPIDESAEALAEAIEPLVTDTEFRHTLAINARAWSRATFEPSRRNAHVRHLLGWDRNDSDRTASSINDLGLSLTTRTEQLPDPG